MINKLNLNGIVELEGSKSILNRILILSTFLRKPFKVGNFSRSKDIDTMVNNLIVMGMKFEKDGKYTLITPPDEFKTNGHYYINDSGTALRFLLVRLALMPGVISQIDVSDQLKGRPVKPLIELLKNIGVTFLREEYPLQFKGVEFAGGRLNISASISSQFISSVLLCTTLLKSDLTINFQGESVSASYIDLTIALLQEFGIKVTKTDDHLFVKQCQFLKFPDFFEIEPDYSSACYYLALGAINKDCIKVKIPSESIQPDQHFLRILEMMGAPVLIEKDLISISDTSLKGITIDMSIPPDPVEMYHDLVFLVLFLFPCWRS